MKRISDLRPTPAGVVACIALFVALGGVSYGFATGSIDSREIADNTIRSRDVRNNSIATSDLRNNEIRGIDIRNSTIHGRDIALDTITDAHVNESKLKQVPDSAALGGVPANQYAKAIPEPVRLIGATGQPPFESGAAAAGGAYLAPGFWLDPVGTVRLQGSVDSAAGIVFTLPAGYRPVARVRFRVPAGAGGAETVTIEATGQVDVTGADPVSLDGIAFRVAP